MRSGLRRLRGRVFQGLDRLLTEERVLHGIPVSVRMSRFDVGIDQLFENVERALDLIAEHQPRRLRRMQQDVQQISVRRYPVCRAAFYGASRTILLDDYFVGAFPEEQIASSIVHEAAHARIRSGVSAQWTRDRAREERFCRKAELSFARALPEHLGAEIAERAAGSLALSDEDVAPDSDWNEPYLRDILQRIEEISGPAWLKRWMIRKAEQRYPLRTHGEGAMSRRP